MARIHALLLGLLLAASAWAQDRAPAVQLDFQSTELTDVIAMMAELTGESFLYDPADVRGRVTVISPAPVTVDEARRAFESMLQVHGLTVVTSPAGALRILRSDAAAGSAIETLFPGGTPGERDGWVTRLLPLGYVRAESLGAALRPLLSARASLIAYAPSNTLIVTDSAANVRHLAELIAPLDVSLYGERIRVLPLRHADSVELAAQLDEIFAGADSATPADDIAGQVLFVADARTNSVIAVATPPTLARIESTVDLLDRQYSSPARLRVVRLLNASAAELAETLVASAELAAETRIVADGPTNSLVIQAGAEDFASLSDLIADLDRRRPQLLLEAVILEIDVTDSQDLGLAWLYQNASGSGFASVGVDPDAALPEPSGLPPIARGDGLIGSTEGAFSTAIIGKSVTVPGIGAIPIAQALLTASRSDSAAKLVSAPVILTADGEEAGIVVGDEIPIPTSRLEIADPAGGFQTSQAIARQNVGVTLRVTPRIGDGDSVRLEIFQELSQVQATDPGLGPTTRNRRLESTVYLREDQAVALGGIVSELPTTTVRRVPLLGRIPVLGRLFRTESETLRKIDVLVVLIPQVVRDPEDLERLSVEQRMRFRDEDGADRRAAVDPSRRSYLVQAGFFRAADDATALLAELIALGYDGSVLSRAEGGPPIHFVELGPYVSEDTAKRIAGELRAAANLRPLVVVAPDR